MAQDPPRQSPGLPHAALLAYGIALVFGSLYPMTGWRWAGAPVFGFLLDPWPRWWTWFDIVFNVAVYLPGGLLATMVLRQGRLRRLALPLAVAACSLAALGLEALQNLLPNRVPSRLDWLANTGGGLLGALLCGAAERLAERIQRLLRQRIAIGDTDSAIGTLLLGIWLLIQWPPQRLLFGQGDILGPMTTLARLLGAQVSLDDWRLGSEQTVFAEALAVAMALVGVGLLVREVLPTRAPRAALTALLLFGAVSVKTVATAAILGPGKSVGWLTAGAQGGLLTGTVILALLASARRSTRLRLAMLALASSSALTSLFPFDAYYASAAGAESGAWRNIDGLLRAACAVWPYATIAWCARRLRLLARHPTDPQARSIMNRTP